MPMSSFYMMFFVWTIFGAVAALIAKQKNRNPYLWFFVGLFFSILGVILVALLPAKQPLESKAETATSAISEVHSEAASPLDPTNTPDITRRIPTNLSIQWFYINDELDTVGPLKMGELRKQLHEYKLGLSTYIWCEEFTDWMQISEFQNSSTILDSDLI